MEKTKELDKKQQIIVLSVVVVITASIAFYGGMRYQSGKSGATRQFGQRGMNFPNGQGAVGGTRVRNGGFVGGEVIKMDGVSMTVKLADGGSKTIFVADDTSILKSATGTRADLSVGANVTANGTVNSDGSITAQSVQLRPAGMAFPGARSEDQTQSAGKMPRD